MPFKSEAQRKYLWANEPAIARDWTDTYGSRIQKDNGGISQLVQPGLGRPGYGGPHETEAAGRSYREAKADTSHHPSGGADNWQKQALQQFAQLPASATTVSTPKVEPKGDGLIDRFRQKSIDSFVHRNKKKNLNRALDYGLMDKLKGRGVDEDEVDSYDIDSIREIASQFGGDLTKSQTKGLGGLRRDFEFEEKYDRPTQTQFQDYYGLNQPTDTGGGEGGQPEWQRLGYPSLAAYQAAMGGGEGGAADEEDDTTSDLGSGHFKVPDEYILAEGGRAGYQMGNMVGAEMEGAEMESAMMQSQEVIKELYDAFIAQGLSPQAAIEKIKEIIASSQTEGPQSPMMGEEFPGQEFGGGPRASAAFGGIMDTYTGRRKYGLGSFFKKAFKKVKKLAGSKLGKLALMYAAGTYLGGTQAFGGTGWGSGAGATPWKKFGAQLLSPTGGQGIGNIFNPTGGLGKGKGWSMFQGAPQATKYGADAGYLTSGAAGSAQKSSNLAKAAGKSDWSKWILPASIGAGAYTAKMPIEELDDVQGEWDEDKEAFDAYLASLDTGDSYRVPDEYIKSAEGGRIGRQEGGLMNLGGMEKDYRNDGGFVPLGGEEKADDVPARLSRNEFVFTADAVRNAGGGDIDKGAEVMENVMKNLEAGGKVSEESQGQGAQDMFEVSERLSEVV